MPEQVTTTTDEIVSKISSLPTNQIYTCYSQKNNQDILRYIKRTFKRKKASEANLGGSENFTWELFAIKIFLGTCYAKLSIKQKL